MFHVYIHVYMTFSCIYVHVHADGKPMEENTSRPLVESGTKPSLQCETGIAIKFEKGRNLGRNVPPCVLALVPIYASIYKSQRPRFMYVGSWRFSPSVNNVGNKILMSRV
jgi:hypothetical protein